MGLFHLRSLLLAAIVLSNCITWTASRHHYTHNVNGHRSRHRRQGAGLYLSASYIVPGGEGGGGWGEWGEVSSCSRTCGGGVASQKRICLEVGPDGRPQCSGGDTKYFSCQTQDCPEGSADFRAEQCSQFDNVSSPAFRGIKYKWVPYTRGPNPCELNCMPQGERFYYRHREKVVDGTLCNEESFNVCVDGKCQPVGCDRMLGSTAKEDKCLNCRGNGTNCHTIRGVLDSQDLRQGYNDMMIIPKGATSIYITEVKDSSNYLALRSKLSSKNGTFYLNGDYHIDFPRSMPIAGATWYYERNQQGLPAPDRLRSQGPIDEPLILVLLLQDQNVGIEYEYSIPTALAPRPDQQYNWVHEDFTPCSATCGGGFQTRNVTCRSREDLDVVDDALCEESIRPPSNQSCNTDACPAQWVEGPWSPCSKPCGQGGSRSRQVHCQKIITNGVTFRFPSLVSDKECFDLLGPKPELFQECNGNASCPTWFTGPWKRCDKLCGPGKQTRLVVCHERPDGRVRLLGDGECGDEKPAAEQDCIEHPCDGVDWVLTEWSGCDSCLSKVRTRSAQCATKSREVVDAKFCAQHAAPALQEPCDEAELPDCEVQWYATQWSNCSTDCGKGVQTRKVFCGLFEKDSVLRVNDSQCSHLPKYNDTKPCEVPLEKCPAQWFTGPWTACDKECGGGEMTRKVMCLKDNKEASSCDYDTIPDSTMACNTMACNADEVTPVDSKSTPIMDDYEDEDEDCVEEGDVEESEEDFSEEGAEEDETLSTIDDMMFSDSPFTSEGSGFSSFMETESGSGDITGSGESDITDATSETISDLTTESVESEATESTLSGATDETTESGPTSESSATVETDGTSESGPTSESDSTDSSTEVTGSSISEETSESGATETEVTGSSVSEETSESGATETEVTGSSVSEETSESGASDSSSESSATDESASTEVTESSSDISTTEETSESSSTDETSDSSPTDETSESSSTDNTSDSSTTDESTEVTSESSVSESSTSESTDVSTEATTSSGDTESTSDETSESGLTDESSGSTEETSSDLSTESGATDLTSESGTEESTVSGSDVTTESGITEESTTSGSSEASSESESTGSTEISTTEVTGSEPTDLTGSTEFSSTESTDTSGYSTESTESTVTEETESTVEGSSTTELSTEESTTESEESSPWDWSSTLGVTSPRVCKRKPRKSKCKHTKFGCCPDNKTAAGGPFEEGCLHPETCKETKFGCCPDGVSPAAGEDGKGCPLPPCSETLYGCCLSDNKTAAEGNDQEGCPPMPPACKKSKYGCCKDGETGATGPKKAGCPETEAKKKAEEEKKKEKERKKEAEKKAKICKKAKFGCCFDNVTLATGPDKAGCHCNSTEFGCCPDNVTAAVGPALEGCLPACSAAAFGCCGDNATAAHGPDREGCCLLYAHGCCPDNRMPAQGPNNEGCSCQNARFGCCPDNSTIAKGPSNEGCGCQYTEHGCCPDNHTPASGPEYEGCGCHTYQFGCCDDGERTAKGPNKQGCHCRESEFGCCGDDKTPATGPGQQGCDCSSSKYGCCPDGQTEASGTKFKGCTDVPENKQAACSLASDRGSCRNYSVYWFYDMEYGGCSRFWYGGCEGNGNRFASKEECEDVCVQPAPKDACKLPQVKGACLGYHLRWYYDSRLERCGQFVFGGCLGNANNFDSDEICKKQCEPERSADQCNLPLAPGSCAGNFPRWGFSPDSKRCEQFTWGGCEGNPNRFSTEAACKERCDPPGRPKTTCQEPQDPGTCSEKIPSWSFNETANRCVPFYYSGCGGNDNRFAYEAHCSETCPPAYVKDVCELPAEVGDCADYRQNWYYDTAQKRCLQFYYGGCGGNENNFPTQAQCEMRCSEPQITTTTTTTIQPTQQQQVYTPAGQEYCFMELDAGPCDKFETRWGYDSTRGQCTTFQYGGCGGNRNNFPDAEYCQYYCNNPQDICQLPMLSGPCEGSEMKWFYDPRSDSCNQFTYGGCEGNGNRFDSLVDCERRCRTGPAAATDTTTTTTTLAPPQDNEIPPECRISLDAEECVQAGEVWYLEPERRECVAYVNRASGDSCIVTGAFPSEEACMRACGPFRNIDVCAYPVEVGPCRESIRKFYFERAAGACLEFSFGGCHGGPNRFSTLDECEQTCVQQPQADPCLQPLEPGNCVYSYPMWYYDQARDACGQFVYSGCNGNDNKFNSREECEGRCQRQRVTPAAPVATPPYQPVDENCRAPPSLEPCGANIAVFHYDEASRRCVASDVGGCRYQGTYQSEEECERNCGAFKGFGSDVCRYPLDVGPCKAAIPKVYFDLTSGRCEQFAYGGCGGGPNRFSSVDECQRVCGPVGPDPACLEEVESGEADCSQLSSRRWYYSTQDAECLPFIFTGCGGSTNNFYSVEHCTQLCKREYIFDTSENEVTPDCSAFTEECGRLQCQFGIQKSHTADGCERCACVQVEVDCAQLEQDCEQLKCMYRVEKTVGEDGCTRCKCISHPCQDKECPVGERCVAAAYRDPISQELRYSADCKTVNKPGLCPAEAILWTTESQCRRECNDDADCRGAGKCCASGCSHLCLEPASYTSPVPRTTTYTPELPQAPQANLATEPSVTGAEGGVATLRCLFHGNPPPTITWRRGEITIDGSVGRYRLLSDGALEIVSLYRNDSGVYICLAQNIHGQQHQEIRLQINDPVELPAGISGEAEAEVTGVLGRSVSLRCLAYGHPPPTVVWHRGVSGPMVPFSSALYEARDNVLLIRRLNEETLGEYTCEAYNGIGKPTSWSVVVRAYRPETRWYPSAQEVLVTQRGPDTTSTTPYVPEITVPVYTVPVKTHIVSESGRLAPGAELSLPCEVDGYPLPNVYWTKDGAPLAANQRTQITESRLTISGLTPSDSGEYGCHASNAYSSHQDSVTISVQGIYIPAQCTDNPFFANCHLIVQSKFCQHKYYSQFCCKSCMQAGQLDPRDFELQADQSWEDKK